MRTSQVEKSLIYYSEGEVIGTRKHMFDWKPGQTITTDGKQTTIYAVFEENENNKKLVRQLFGVLNSTTSKVVCDIPADFFDGFPADLKPMAVAMFSHRTRRQKYSFDQKFEIMDKFLDYFTNVEFDEA